MTNVNAARTSGFSMIEVSVVLVVIAILSVLAVPTFLNSRARSMDNVALSNLVSASTQALAHHTETNTFGPPGATSLPVEDWVSSVHVFVPHRHVACLDTVSEAGTAWAAIILPHDGGVWYGRGPSEQWCAGPADDVLTRVRAARDADGDGMADGDATLPPLAFTPPGDTRPEEQPDPVTTTEPLPPEDDPLPPPEPLWYEPFNLYVSGNTSCNPTLAINTSDRVLEGSLHSNGSIQSYGSSGRIDGLTSYVGSVGAWPMEQFAGGVSQVAPFDHVFPYVLGDYAPGSEKASMAGGDYHFYPGNVSLPAESLTPGLYYAAGNIQIYQNSSADLELLGVTLVAEGSISVSGSNITLSPWDPDGVTFYANSNGVANCYGTAVHISTSNLAFDGVLAAPNGKVSLFTSSTTSVTGHIVAYAAQITGTSLVMLLP